MDEHNWEGASDDEIGDGIDDGEEGALREYGSRIFGELQRAKALLRRWARHHLHHGLEYETVAFLDGPEAARKMRTPTAEAKDPK